MYLFIYFTSLHVSSNPVLIIRRIELYQYIIWYLSLCVGDCLVCRSGPAYVSSCGVCTECCAVHGTQYTHHNLKHMLPLHCTTYNNVFSD